MATAVEICNSALQKIGGDQITSLSDNNRRAKLCNLMFDPVRRRLLRSHPWNFAMRREILERQTLTIASAAISTANDTLTHVLEGLFLAGDTITVATNGAGDPTFTGQTLPFTAYVRPTSETTVTLHASVADAESGDNPIDITAAGTTGVILTLTAKNSAELTSPFKLPTGFLRAVREAYKDTDWKIEGFQLLTDKSRFELLYIFDADDTTLYDQSFTELFAMELAVELSYSLVQSLSLKEQLKSDLKQMKADIRSFDAQEGQPERFEDIHWLNSRL